MSRVAITGCRQAWLLPLGPRLLGRVLRGMLERAPGSVELCLVRDGSMALLNRRHLGCAGPTNILAFPSSFSPPCGGDGPLGSLVLCVDAARREAMLYGQEEAEYCLRLLAHGLAHLLEHDHGPEMDSLCEDLLYSAKKELLSAC